MTCLLIKLQLCLLAPRPRLHLQNLGVNNKIVQPNSATVTPSRIDMESFT